MLRQSAQHLLLVGLYVLTRVFLYLDNLSALGRITGFSDTAGRRYACLGAADPGAALDGYGSPRALGYLGKHHYALSEQWLQSGGSNDLDVLAMRGSTFCHWAPTCTSPR